MTHQTSMMEDLSEAIADDERMLEERVNGLDHTRVGDYALRMLRNASRVGTVKKVKETIQTITRLAPTPVLEAITTSLEIAQSFVFVRTGEAVDIRR